MLLEPEALAALYSSIDEDGNPLSPDSIRLIFDLEHEYQSSLSLPSSIFSIQSIELTSKT